MTTTDWRGRAVAGDDDDLPIDESISRRREARTLLERRHIVGGAAVTEEFHPGFRNSVASYTVSLLRPKVIKDMRLHERGWRIIERTKFDVFHD